MLFAHFKTWWRHQVEIFCASLALCAGNSQVTGEFPSQKPVTRSFDCVFDLRLSKRLGKQWRCRWFETPSRSLRRHCNEKNCRYKFSNMACAIRLKELILFGKDSRFYSRDRQILFVMVMQLDIAGNFCNLRYWKLVYHGLIDFRINLYQQLSDKSKEIYLISYSDQGILDILSHTLLWNVGRNIMRYMRGCWLLYGRMVVRQIFKMVLPRNEDISMV